MSFLDEAVPELEAPPADSWHEVEPPTDVDAASAPGLDLVVLAGVRRAIGSSERLTAAGLHAEALDDARRALELLLTALGGLERRALVDRLVSDVEPGLSAERDVRHAEAE